MNMLSKSLPIAVLLAMAFSISNVTAQTITGTVREADSGKPLPRANIIQVQTHNGISTDDDGHFTLKLQPGAPPKVRVSYVGYASQVIHIQPQSEPLTIALKRRTIQTNEVFVEALRVDDSVPVASKTIKSKEIKSKNLGRDLPYLLSNTPSTVVTSDAGAGIGYTGIRIRGVEPSRINVTINGIPVNDAESQSVFWVDIPDLASSVESIQVQRGVGTSTNGAGAFGGSINVQTSKMRKQAFGAINVGGGSFNTRRFNVKLGSGLMDNGWQVQGRLSKTASDGYIDRAFSDLKSFYLSAAHHGKHGLLRADVFSGTEKTYQAYYGVPGSKLDSDRTYNPAGTEKPGNPYKNQTDNYQQDHYQLHYSYNLSTRWKANASLFYVYGRGYYEEYKANQKLGNYDLQPVTLPDTTITQSDLVRRQWLDNHYYGTVFSTKYEGQKMKLTLGGGYNEYRGNHYGTVIKSEFFKNLEESNRYYDNDAFKSDGNLYAKLNYNFTDAFSGYVDLQVRHIKYDFLGKDLQDAPGGGQDTVDIKQTDKLNFFNPKVGLVYRLTEGQRVYASLSVGNKEPARDEYVDSTPATRPSAETLYDWEAGYKLSRERFTAGANFYYMDYQDQLIPTGEINDVGAVVRRNVPDSYRAGIELQAGARILPTLQWSLNGTFSHNKIVEYNQFYDNYDTGGQVSQTYEDTDIAFSPSFIGNSIINFSTHGFTAELTSKYVARQYLDNTQTKSRSIDPYFVNNLRLAYDFGGLSLAENIKATLQINNIFDEKYITNGSTFGDVSGGREEHFNYYYPQAGTNFLARISIGF